MNIVISLLVLAFVFFVLPILHAAYVESQENRKRREAEKLRIAQVEEAAKIKAEKAAADAKAKAEREAEKARKAAQRVVKAEKAKAEREANLAAAKALKDAVREFKALDSTMTPDEFADAFAPRK